jgi:phage/plasmid-like protein (TIGR03299 family)
MHEIEFTNGQADIAYVGETPWHHLGQVLTQGAEIGEWAKAAGLAHEVRTAPVQFMDDEGAMQMNADRNVLYRSDNKKPLGVVGNRYNVVQPSQILEFFKTLAETNHFQLEVAGALNGGKRIWALARVGEGAPVVGHDVVLPYVLLATSYDGTMATVAQPTTVRVVCNNTIQMALSKDQEKRITVPHNQRFDAREIRLDLGIAMDSFDRFMIDARKLAKKEVNDTFAAEFLKMLLPNGVSIKNEAGTKTITPIPVEETKLFGDIMTLYKGEAMGADLKEASGTAWGLLNAITQHTDHVAGRTTDSRLTSAWFGKGNDLKSRAADLLLEVIQ